MIHRVIACGSRDWDDEETIERVLTEYERSVWASFRYQKEEGAPYIILLHGASPAGGADEIIDKVARALGFEVVPYPPDPRLGSPDMFHARNQAMADSEAELCIAFWNGRRRPNGASGTMDMCQRALQAGTPVKIHPPRRRY